MLGFGKRKSVSPGNIAAVVSGQIIPIEKVKDEAFAKKMTTLCENKNNLNLLFL